MYKYGFTWFCKMCAYQNNNRGHMKEHVEAKHLTHDGYVCNSCQRVYKTNASLRVHSYRCKSVDTNI